MLPRGPGTSTRTWDTRTEAQQTAPVLSMYPGNGRRPPTIQRTCVDTSAGSPRRPADGPEVSPVSTHDTGVHFSSCALPKTSHRHWEAVFLRFCAPQDDQSGSAVDWRPPKSGGPATQGTDPETQLNEQGCYAMAASSLHRSWSWFTHGERTNFAHCSNVVLHAPMMGYLFSTTTIDARAGGREFLVNTVEEKPKSLRLFAWSTTIHSRQVRKVAVPTRQD